MFYLSYSILFDSTRAFLTAQLKSSLLVLVRQLMRGMKEKTRGPSPDTEVARFAASADEMTVIRGIVKGNEGKNERT
ncbi:hypothetical protein ACS0TY_014250 [Phlomoides rotata]